MVRSRKKRKRLHLERFQNVMSEKYIEKKRENYAKKKLRNSFHTDLGIKNSEAWRCKENWLTGKKK
tara:strand:+ start:1610 stop:1807 length:198 start_codon:yes stop_codon:yes gene_type:complete